MVTVLVAGCSVAIEDTTLVPGPGFGGHSASSSAEVGTSYTESGVGAFDVSGLVPIGPSPGSSHWHAAYVVRVCDEVLDPFEDAQASHGIHTHGDGLIHVHPATEIVGFERATLRVFTEVVGLRLDDG